MAAAHRAALQTDTGPDIRLLVHIVSGMLQASSGRHQQALQEFSAAEHLRSQMAGSPALANQVTGWMLATQARLGDDRARPAPRSRRSMASGPARARSVTPAR